MLLAANSTIRDQVAFVAAFVPYGSMRTLALDIASATRDCGGGASHGGSIR